MINEKTQLGKVVSLLKGFERYFYAEDEKSILDLKKSSRRISCVKAQGGGQYRYFSGLKSIFRLQRKSNVQTLLGAKQPHQVAYF